MADNFTFKDASGTNRTARAKDNSSVHLPATVISDQLGNLIAADDAAAAGPIFPAAGVYQATADPIDSGDIGRLRMSERRILLVSNNDFVTYRASHTSVSSAGDIEVSEISGAGGYVAANTGFFDGADSGFSTSQRFIRFSMMGFNECLFSVQNNLGVNVTLTVYLYILGITVVAVFTQASLANGIYHFSPRDVGTGANANFKIVPALLNATEYIVVGITPATDPSGGNIAFFVNRK
jgi:hypothetical protein